MANVKNPSDILVGTGRVYINGTDVGQVDGDVEFTHKKTTYEKKSGFPAVTVLSVTTEESIEGKFDLLEANLDTLRGVMPEYALVTVGAGTAAVTDELLSGISASRKSALTNSRVADSGVTVALAARLSAAADSGATVLHLESVRGFRAGDSVTLVSGSTTESVTIASAGVDAGALTLTLSAGLTNSYATGAIAKDTTVSLTEGTDYYVDRLDGTIWLKTGSTKLAEGDALAVGYTHATYSGRGFSAGGGSGSDTTYLLDFWHKRRDGRYRRVRIHKAKISGDFAMKFAESKESPVELSITGIADSTRAAGDQLWSVIDYAASAAPGGGW